MKPPKVSITEFLFKELLDFYFGRLKKYDNYRPDWLNGLEIDRYYPEIKVGVEFQGIQHYRPTKGMHENRDQFFDQLSRDTQKIQVAAKQGVKIFPLGLADISPERFKYNMKQIARAGTRTAHKNKDTRVVNIFKFIDWNREPNPKIFKRLEGIRRSPKWKARDQKKKKGLLRRIFGF